jgi:ribosome-associated toxin RatA of RatAB toxin-antitoxin module
MAVLTTDHIFNGTPVEVFKGIRNFEKYPDYIPMISSIEVGKPIVPKSVALVTFKVNLVKTFYYSLHMFEEAPLRLWWDLHESNLMKKSHGSWLLEEKVQGTTLAHYSLDVAFKGLVPQMMIDKVTQSSLAPMMEGFQKLVNAEKSA